MTVSGSVVPGITRAERSEFDEALEYFKAKAQTIQPGSVLNFNGVPVDKMTFSERDRIRTVLEYRKETSGIVQRNGHATVYLPTMKSGAVALQESQP